MAQLATVPRPSQTQLQTPSIAPSKKNQIKLLLGKLAVRRQTQIGEADFRIYSEDLMPYLLEDIVELFDKIGLREDREDGQTAFPPMVKLIKRLDSAVNQRKRAELERLEALERAEKERLYQEDLAANPEKYAQKERENKERYAALMSRHGLGAPQPKPTPPPVMTACPHCEKPLPLTAGIRLMTGHEVQEMGKMMSQLEVQRAEQREANRIHSDKCVEVEIAKAKL